MVTGVSAPVASLREKDMTAFRFTGRYTGKRDTIVSCGVTFIGREPSEVTDADGIRRLSNHPEFEIVEAEPEAEAPDEAPKPRGRPRKA